jgi:hypothetical protein
MKITYEMLPNTGEFNVLNDNKIIGILGRFDRWWKFNPTIINDLSYFSTFFILNEDLQKSKDELIYKINTLKRIYESVC